MANWPTVKLADCVNLLAGFAFKSELFTDKPDDIALVKGENVSQGRILWEISKRWPAADWEKMEKFQLHSADVVVAMDRPWIPAGLKWAQIRDDDPKALLVQRCARLRSSNSRLDQGFLRFVIGGPGFENYVKPITSGVNVPHISGQQILDYDFTLPPAPVQRRIAGILSAYDDLIENSQRRIKILEAMSRALYREWFVHFRFPGHDAARDVDALPRDWREMFLEDIAELQLGKMLDQNKNRGQLLPYLANVNVRWGEFALNELREMRFEHHERETYGLKFGDIVMCEGGEPGRCAIWKDQISGMMIQKALHRIRCREDMSFNYLYHSLRHLGESGALASLFTGSTIKHLPQEKLAKVKMIRPPVHLLELFDSIVGAMESHIYSLQCQIQNLRRTRDLLLPRLLSGDVVLQEATL